MHSFYGKTCNIYFEDDHSGVVEVTIKETGLDAGEVCVDFDDLKSMVADYVRQRKIKMLEDSTDDEILIGGITNG